MKQVAVAVAAGDGVGGSGGGDVGGVSVTVEGELTLAQVFPDGGGSAVSWLR